MQEVNGRPGIVVDVQGRTAQEIVEKAAELGRRFFEPKEGEMVVVDQYEAHPSEIVGSGVKDVVTIWEAEVGVWLTKVSDCDKDSPSEESRPVNESSFTKSDGPNWLLPEGFHWQPMPDGREETIQQEIIVPAEIFSRWPHTDRGLVTALGEAVYRIALACVKEHDDFGLATIESVASKIARNVVVHLHNENII